MIQLGEGVDFDKVTFSIVAVTLDGGECGAGDDEEGCLFPETGLSVELC